VHDFTAIKEAIAEHRAIVVIGTGVTAASVADPTNCSWPGLLRAGVKYLVEHGLMPHASIKDSIEADISIGSEINSEYLLTAASKIFNQMGGLGAQHFNEFLGSTIGQLRPDKAKSALVQGLGNLGVPLITTNYDTIIEQITGRPHTTWRDARTFRSALTGRTDEVIHLHGIWNDPASVVLSTLDYSRVIQDDETEALRNSAGIMNTLIFVGFGNGLNDPHFSAIWNWLRPISAIGSTHYTLCRESELERVAQANLNNPLVPISYGSQYSDLITCIKELIPPEVSQSAATMSEPRTFESIRQTCRLRLLDGLSDTAVIPKPAHLDIDERDIDDLVIEPIMLPVPPEQFAREKSFQETEVSPLEPLAELNKNKFIIMVGEEQTGLTTALHWAAIKKCDLSGSIPVPLDYLQLGTGNRMVQNAVRKYLRAAGAPINNKEPLPGKIVVVIDNITASRDSDLNRLVNEVIGLDADLMVLGCRPGTDIRLQSLFDQHDVPAAPAYLGRLGLQHAVELAKRVDPQQAAPVANRVLYIAHKEGLARTPLSLTLLIIGVVSDQGWINTVSNTSFVDAFVDSLLGRGGFRDDMRLQIDSGGYSRVLEALAKKLIIDDSASISYVDLIKFFGDIISTLDWSDRPEDIIRSLVYKGLLVDRDSSIKFRQSAYLHIFAARAARLDPKLLDTLKSRPLYYSNIIRNYAALQRSDEGLVQWAHGLLGYIETFPPPTSGIYAPVASAELDANARSLDKLAEGAGDDDDQLYDLESTTEAEGPKQETGHLSTAPEEAAAGKEEDDGALATYDPFESLPDDDREPFPSTDLENAPIDIKMQAQLSLVSNILRDSELVENPALKEEVLIRTLTAWGIYLNYVHESPRLKSMLAVLVEVLADRLNFPDEKAEIYKSRLVESWAMFSTYEGIAEDLSTIKLQRALQRLMADTDNLKAVHLMIPALFLQFMLNSDGWDEPTAQMLVSHSNIRAARVFVDLFLYEDYEHSRPGTARSARLEEVISEFYMSDNKSLEARRRGRVRARIIEYLRKDRARHQAIYHRSSDKELPSSSGGNP
jgi:hypothetical protein